VSTVTIAPQTFQEYILRWFDQHGRKHLPWQINKTPYRVWVSEIMLQQTQVATVIPYFERFMQHFPDLASLAQAADDEVLHQWAGLGYYRRARHLHHAAKIVMERHQGQFPSTLEDLCALPGIGQSTAGAILSIAFHHPAPILDGNVKRVLARFHAIMEPVNEKRTEDKLWDIAHHYTPLNRVADYTQAMMDLGATLCTRTRPTCMICPLVSDCSAHQQGLADLLPTKKATRELPIREATLLILKKGKHVLLYKRPPSGIWGGLWSLPEIPGTPKRQAIRHFCQQHFQLAVTDYETFPAFRHTFSHYHLDIRPVLIEIKKAPPKIVEAGQQIWYNPNRPEAIGLPKPIQSLMRALT
jgi:A/G-specific adenine glycosylase